MVRLLLVFLALAGDVRAALAQDAPLVFRSDAYVVGIDYQPLKGAPMVGLTSSDCTVTIGKHLTVPVKVVDDPARPGFYRITFSPPDSLRDGKKHRVDVARTNKKPVLFDLIFAKPNKPDQPDGEHPAS
jgi:hypothetical protein